MTRGTFSIDYPPRPAVRYGWGQPPARYLQAVFDHHREAQRAVLNDLAQFRRQLSFIPILTAEDDPSPRWVQDWIPPLDGLSLYGLTATRKPARIIEIGSGNSTKFLRRAIQDHRLSSHLTSIDPQPRAEINDLADHIERQPLEACDMARFDSLRPGDMVFFDGSHRCFQNSDVTVFFIECLPRLPAGVLVGIHDIRWPADYPESWLHRLYSEQYVLAAYILGQGDRFPLVLSNAYASTELAREAENCLDPTMRALLADAGRPQISGTILWFETPSVPFASLGE